MRRHGHKDIVTPALREYVLRRDGACLAWQMDPEHVCRDLWGQPHAPNDLGRLSLEHVKSELRLGRRAESDPAHLVALCASQNIGVPSKALRTYMRAYLASVNGNRGQSVDTGWTEFGDKRLGKHDGTSENQGVEPTEARRFHP